MNSYNVGIIGYGWVAGAHIAALHATGRARVTSILSSRPLDEAKLSAQHGVPVRVFRDQKEFLAQPDLQVVSVCSYPQDHARQAIAVAQAGKHLILEKPIALNREDLARVREAVAAAGIRSCVCFECRYSSQIRTAKAFLDQGLLGRVHYAEVDYFHGIGPWYGQYRWNVRRQAGGSSLLSAGCHAMDALLLLMGGDVEVVSSYSTHSAAPEFAAYEYPTTSVTILRFRDGRVGKCASVIDCQQPYYFRVHLIGSEGTLLDDKFFSTKLGGLNRKEWSRLGVPLLDSGDVGDHPYQAQFEAFFQALDHRRDMEGTSLEEASK
ncbi:MAG: Gfo/Idh/MocA family protein, partial [Limisphaerales bacterium]